MTTVNLTADQLAAIINAISSVQSGTSNNDNWFLIVCGAMVYSKGLRQLEIGRAIVPSILVMQAGFAFLEGGSVRSINTTNSLFRNLVCSCKFCYFMQIGQERYLFFSLSFPCLLSFYLHSLLGVWLCIRLWRCQQSFLWIQQFCLR